MAPADRHIGILAAAYVNLKSVLFPQTSQALVGCTADRLGQCQAAPRAAAQGKAVPVRVWSQNPFHECVFGVLAMESEPVDPRL
jgi:hypothetical protein